jgi:hypothetical protein
MWPPSESITRHKWGRAQPVEWQGADQLWRIVFCTKNVGAIAQKRAFICRAISVGRFMTSGVRLKCLLFPKADVQISRNSLISGAANGHKQTLAEFPNCSSRLIV